jgi:hypothetical protein
VPAKGYSTKLVSYKFTDESPVDGMNYYRLRINEMAGTFKYSEVKSVFFDRFGFVNIINALPNPFQNFITLNYNSAMNGNVSIRIIDAMGRVILSKESTAVKGLNSIQFDSEQLSKGVYFITVCYEGSYSKYKMLLKE